MARSQVQVQGPDVVVIAGPNGAGKSTSAPALLRDLFGIDLFVNADEIARGLAGFAPERSAVQAGRLMLRRIRELAASGESFGFETTLASRSFASFLSRIRQEHGYRVSLVFLWLPRPEQAVARVADRVMRGGHHVTEEVIRRRHARGLRNLTELYMPLVDAWLVYNNEGQGVPSLVASKVGTEIEIHDDGCWQRITGPGDEFPGAGHPQEP